MKIIKTYVSISYSDSEIIRSIVGKAEVKNTECLSTHHTVFTAKYKIRWNKLEVR